MLTLALLRHAEASRNATGAGDADRDLTAEGEMAARRLGRWMAAHGVGIDLALTSSARRARRTCELVLDAFDPRPAVVDEPGLYLASPRTLLGRVKLVPDHVRRLLVVGHNPGLHAFATTLVDAGPADVLAHLDEDLPTAGLVLLEIDAPRFAGLRAASARLVDFVMPKNSGD